MSKSRDVDIRFQLALPPRRGGRKKGPPKPPAKRPIPRLTRLLALAIKFEGLLRDGVVRDYADLARLGHVTRARMSQIMRLLDLAPSIQETILLDQPAITERAVREVVLHVDWNRQRKAWAAMLKTNQAARGG